MCDSCEYIWSHGSDVLDPEDPSKVVVDSPLAIAGLADLLRWMLEAEEKNVYAEVGSFFGAEAAADVTLRIAGTSGVLDIDPFARPLRTFDHQSRASSWSYTGEDMNTLMLADFLRGVAEDKPAGASGIDGLRALEIVLAAYASGEVHERKSVERTPIA